MKKFKKNTSVLFRWRKFPYVAKYAGVVNDPAYGKMHVIKFPVPLAKGIFLTELLAKDHELEFVDLK